MISAGGMNGVMEYYRSFGSWWVAKQKQFFFTCDFKAS